ncbi:MAG: hypothetical protein M1813_000738 [Trichoglossum hirsutum]|nr:MAG: hypothetical protein M1813_000738 [Trichoglossum hirsutum]
MVSGSITSIGLSGYSNISKQERVVQRVLGVPSDSYYEVLGLRPGENDKVRDAGDRLLGALDLGVNSHPNATEAFEIVHQAIENLQGKDTDMEEPEEEEEEEEEAGGRTSSSARVSPAIDYPWTCGLTAEGERIITHRLKTSRGTIRGYTCVVETQREKGLLYKFKPGAEIGQLELTKYLSQDGIKTLAEKGADGKRKKVWSYKDVDQFVDIL